MREGSEEQQAQETWLHRREEKARVDGVVESLLDLIYHVHELLRDF